MPIYRCVSKTDASTPEAAAEFIRQDTGGAVTQSSGFAVIDEGDCWRVPVFSMYGRAAMPFPVGAVFPNDSRMSDSSDSEIDRQIGQFGDCEEQGWTPGIATGPGFRK